MRAGFFLHADGKSTPRFDDDGFVVAADFSPDGKNLTRDLIEILDFVSTNRNIVFIYFCKRGENTNYRIYHIVFNIQTGLIPLVERTAIMFVAAISIKKSIHICIYLRPVNMTS